MIKPKPRHRRKAPIDGDRVRVLRMIDSGETVEDVAIVHVIDKQGRVVLERVRDARGCNALASLWFLAASDYPIPGWPDFYIISGFMVRMFPYIARRSNAAKMIDRAA